MADKCTSGQGKEPEAAITHALLARSKIVILGTDLRIRA